jgi:hypothetical protein
MTAVVDIRHIGCTHVRYIQNSNRYLGFTYHTFLSRWKTDVNSFPSLDSQIQNGPTFVYEYNTRETYGQNITGWGPNDPLNATWWHLVTEGTHMIFFFLVA